MLQSKSNIKTVDHTGFHFVKGSFAFDLYEGTCYSFATNEELEKEIISKWCIKDYHTTSYLEYFLRKSPTEIAFCICSPVLG